MKAASRVGMLEGLLVCSESRRTRRVTVEGITSGGLERARGGPATKLRSLGSASLEDREGVGSGRPRKKEGMVSWRRLTRSPVLAGLGVRVLVQTVVVNWDNGGESNEIELRMEGEVVGMTVASSVRRRFTGDAERWTSSWLLLFPSIFHGGGVALSLAS
jgi:phosphodiesterase/alkaline phosphatase D-like protein